MTLSSQLYSGNILLCVALGTNDLGYGESADTLLPALLGRVTGARTVALSIPQFALELVRERGRGREGREGGRRVGHLVVITSERYVW